MKKQVCVLGAGSIGVSIALHLQLKGWVKLLMWPTFPVGKPVIGLAPKHENFWLAFGHGYLGLN